MNHQYDVSVVVPMYNVEKYISKCVDSLLAQTLGDRLQIVLVDDGSPDSCGVIGDNYALHYDNIVCVHKENGGLGPARNTGISHSDGRYIGFVDSDDWVDPSMYQVLLDTALDIEASAVYSGMRTVCNGSEIEAYPQPYGDAVLVNSEQVKALRCVFFGAPPSKVKMEPFQVSVCPAIYDKDVILKNDIAFENIRSEDITFNLDFLEHAERIACVDHVFYNYRKEEQASITSTFSLDAIDEYINLFEEIDSRLPVMGDPFAAEAELRFDRRVIDCFRGALVASFSKLDKEDCDVAFDRILNSIWLKKATRTYPWREIPIQQGLFLLAMKYRCRVMLGIFCLLKTGGWRSTHVN